MCVNVWLLYAKLDTLQEEPASVLQLFFYTKESSDKQPELGPKPNQGRPSKQRLTSKTSAISAQSSCLKQKLLF